MKTTKRWLLAATAGIAMGCIFFTACKKENSGASANTSGQSRLSIYMMDDPVAFTKVLIDIKQVAVKIDTANKNSGDDDNMQWFDDYRGCKGGRSAIWDTLSITPGVYDLLKLRNGTDTLLSSSLVPNGKVLQVRITLGTNNTVYTDSVTSYPLNIIGPGNSFDINVRREDISTISNSEFKLWFDFNLSKSIFYFNNKYWLKPVLTPFNDSKKPKLEGRVLPQGAAGYVQIYNQTDTLYALPWIGGYYQVRGISAGTYSIYFKGWHGYKDTTINNITVAASGLTTAPTVTLHK
ncbi:MAG: DUF4382 domain-containing protein [Chitinophagaceae bacterium]